MNLLVDTTLLIDVLRKRPAAMGLLDLASAQGDLYTSAMNVAELYGGMRVGEEAKTEAFLAGIRCVPVTAAIAKHGGELKTSWARRGRTLSTSDMIVAATALQLNLALATSNRKNFPMDGMVFLAGLTSRLGSSRSFANELASLGIDFRNREIGYGDDEA